MLRAISTQPTAGETKKPVTAIMLILKTWRLGILLPFVSFFIIGSISSASYGRGRFIAFRTTVSRINPDAGTIVAYSAVTGNLVKNRYIAKRKAHPVHWGWFPLQNKVIL